MTPDSLILGEVKLGINKLKKYAVKSHLLALKRRVIILQ
ncbi:hypothetical protein SVI_2100 [Shewanella violacea DSS12]|uniref:Uncharacterized protein n=1 Tax=Shewanella violacea (strain JCM 10179 / CIP 106290 / LMG 19151 / DSS12) TaxID=637905 RepID=D4ZK72_SHEVD|nr:hypothetical protein SVI_2100 [Shewanella violacea DSS12]